MTEIFALTAAAIGREQMFASGVGRTTYGATYKTRDAAQDALESFCAAGEISEADNPKITRRLIRLSIGVRDRFFVEIND